MVFVLGVRVGMLGVWRFALGGEGILVCAWRAGSGFRVQGLGLRVQWVGCLGCVGCRVYSVGCWV